VEERSAEEATEMDADGIIVVHARDASAARRSVDAAVGRVAKEWRVTEPVQDGSGHFRFEVLLRFRKNGDPVEVMAELEERCSRSIAAAEYIPFRSLEDEE
jgi:hypothetical protein